MFFSLLLLYSEICDKYRRCGMIANEKAINQKPNDEDVNFNKKQVVVDKIRFIWPLLNRCFIDNHTASSYVIYMFKNC